MGKQWKQWQTLFSWVPKNTVDVDCSHEIKRLLLCGRKAMTNLDSILKSRGITLPMNIHLIKGMVFSEVMYECENWTIKKVECWRIDAFEVWGWRGLLRVPWTARRSKQSILKEIKPECSLEGLMLKLNLQYFDQLTHGKRPWCWKRLKAGREGDDRGCNGWMAHWLDRYEFEQALAFGDGQGSLRAAVHGVTKNQTWLSNWTELKTEINHNGKEYKNVYICIYIYGYIN